MITDCEFLLNYTVTSLIFITRARFLQSVLITKCGCHDDGGSRNCRNACAPISVHFKQKNGMQKDQKQNSVQRFLSVGCSELDCLHYFSYILSTIIHGIENVTHLTLPSRGESINLYFLIYYLTIPVTEIPTNIVTCGILMYMNTVRKSK